MKTSNTILILSASILGILMLSGCSKNFMSGFAAGRERAHGLRLLKEEKYKEAIDHFKQAIAIYPSGPSYTYLGMCYEKIGNYNEAIKDFNTAIDRFNTATEQKEVIVTLRKLNGAPTLGSAYRGAASAYLKQNDIELAQSYIKKAIDLEPTVSRNFCVKAQVEHTLKDDTQAIADADKAIDLDSHYADAYGIRGLCELSTGKYSQSVADCDTAIAINAHDAEAQKTRALAVAHIVKHPKH